MLKNNLLSAVLLILSVFAPVSSWSANDYVEVTAPGNRVLKLAIAVPGGREATQERSVNSEIASVIAFDLAMSGIVAPEVRDVLPIPGIAPGDDANLLPWFTAGFDLLIRSELTRSGNGFFSELRLYDVFNRKLMSARRVNIQQAQARQTGHSFADEVMQALTGEKGPFSSRISFVSSRSGNKEIYIMDWDGHQVSQITRNGSINLNPDFSSDGRDILFTSYKKGNPDMYRKSIASGAELLISDRKGNNITGAWSPDGTKIALSMSKDGDAEVYMLSREGTSPQRLTINPAIDISPTWSPDMKRIAFVSDRHGKPHIFVMNADGGGVLRLTQSGSYNVTPRWSPKGDRIAYARMQGGGFQIYSMNQDGSGDTQLTAVGSNENPVWSPDGRFIAFSSRRDGIQSIYVMRADGSAQTRISRDKANALQPAWSPRMEK